MRGLPTFRHRRSIGLALGFAAGLYGTSLKAVAGDDVMPGTGFEPLGNSALATVHGRGSDGSTAVSAGTGTGVILWDEVWSDRGSVNTHNANQGLGNAQSVTLTLKR